MVSVHPRRALRSACVFSCLSFMPFVALAEEASPPAEPPPLTTVVTATRGTPIGESAAATTVLLPREVRASPGRAFDEVLRSVPAVSLPRSDSRALHPTAQSVSLRGVGRGRTLVLLDGVPLNDPFGGWIQWNKLPRSQLERVETVFGATSNLYGSLAMGGVIQAFTRPVSRPRLVIEGDYGNGDTPHLALFGAMKLGEDGSVGLSADVFRSDGHPVVSRAFAGAVDRPAGFESQNVGARGAWSTHWGELWATANYFREERSAGTELTGNRQWTADAATGLHAALGEGQLELQLFGGAQRFHNENSRVDATRSSELRALSQEIPVAHLGGSALWSTRLGERQTLALGVDSRFVDAVNREEVFDASGAFTGVRSAAGRQVIAGVFGDWSIRPIEVLTVSAGLRADAWWNIDGRQVSLDGVETRFQERRDLALSPRVTAVLRTAPSLAFRAAAYSGFRAPNLNELYRGYFAGRVLVTPNPQLGAERLVGGELGADWDVVRGARVALTAFASQTYDRIEQTTIDPLTRQRRNIAEAQAAGAELQLNVRLLPQLRLSGGYALTLSRISSFPESVELVGKQLPNTPVHSAAATLKWTDPRLVDATLRVRAEGRAFADERNDFALPAFAVVDLSVSRSVVEHVELFASMANVLDAEVMTDRNQTMERVGAPRTVWGGFRVEY